jgi:hypothetical protein
MYYPNISLEGLKKITKNISKDNRCPDWDSNTAPPEYKSRALSLRQPATFYPPIYVCVSQAVSFLDVFFRPS